jgi:hypothetical protein
MPPFNTYNRLADLGLFVLISYIFDVFEPRFKVVASMAYKIHKQRGNFLNLDNGKWRVPMMWCLNTSKRIRNILISLIRCL